MPVTPTQLFQFLEKMDGLIVERHEFQDPCFNWLRSGIGHCLRQLSQSEDDDAAELSRRLKSLLYTWLATPVEFDADFLKSLTAEGDAQQLWQRWQIPFGDCIKAAEALAGNVAAFPNPLRDMVRTALTDLRQQNKSFKIYCWKAALPSFSSIFAGLGDEALSDSLFIHSLAAYRQAELFDVLIKVGPLRSKGICQLPDSVLSAPKFHKLIQFVWSGCNDEAGAGLDPAGNGNGNFLEATPAGKALQVKSQNHESHRHWTPGRDAVKLPDQMPNEFDQFNATSIQNRECHARLVDIGDGDQWVITPHAEVLSFDPALADQAAVMFREVSSELSPGMFLILPHTSELDLGVAHHRNELGPIWKKRLFEQLETGRQEFCESLKRSGLRRRGGRPVNNQWVLTRIKYWAEEASESPHAPKEWHNFKVLIRALDLSQAEDWTERAWKEVTASRGEAQKQGREETEIEKETQLTILRKLLEEIRKRAARQEKFHIKIPERCELTGGFALYRIVHITDEYLVPTDRIRTIADQEDMDIWQEA